MRASLSTLAVLVLALPALAQKPTLKPDDYKQWQSLSAARISPNGKWISYQISLVDGDGSLVIKDSDGPVAAAIPVGSGLTFTEDSKWCAYVVSPPKAIADKLRDEKKPIENKLGLRNLETGKEQVFDAVQRYFFTRDAKTLVMHRYRGAEKKDGGSDVTVMNLASGESVTIGNVAEVRPNREGSWLALRIESDSGDKGVQLLRPENFSLRTLQWGKDSINGLDWAGKSDVLAFLVGKRDEKKEGDANSVIVARHLDGTPEIVRLEPTETNGIPAGMRIAEWRGVALNDEGTAVAFGIADWADRTRPQGKPEDKSNVEIWNYRDLRVMPEQKRNLMRDKQRTDLATWWIGSPSARRITTAETENPTLMGDWSRVLVQDVKPYLSPTTNGLIYRDLRLVDTKTGEARPVLQKQRWMAIPSREGRYLTWFENKNWWLLDLDSAKKSNLTGSLKVSFENEENDYTIPEKPPVGGVLWLKNDSGLMLFSRYDAWLVDPTNGSVERVTDGQKDRLVYRYEDTGLNEDGADLAKPFFFSVFDEHSKASGFARLQGDGTAKLLTLDNARLFNLTQSKDTDRVIFQMSTFEKPADLYLSNLSFTAIKPESKLNPQQANYAWGKAELIDFKSRWGKELQGILVYPADYQPGRSYPMVTYIYERLSDGLHNYSNPVEWSSYNAQALSQDGYFVFMPDIAYKGRTPGQNAVDCLEPAVAAVLAKKVGVDPDRIGLMGHSWGGYQTAFVTSVSKVFKAGVAGAPLTELTSMYNSFYWNSGVSNQVLLETGQGRLEVPFWEDPKTYFDNSPVWQSSKRTAPILIAQGDQDGAVDWHQGLALYQTLRRMGKPCVLLVYPGENHGLAKRANQLDYAQRLRHFFDVYLKGEKPQEWVSSGIPLVKQGS